MAGATPEPPPTRTRRSSTTRCMSCGNWLPTRRSARSEAGTRTTPAVGADALVLQRERGRLAVHPAYDCGKYLEMSRRYPSLLALAVMTALSLSACKKADPAASKLAFDTMITEVGAIHAALPKDAGESRCALSKLKAVKDDQVKFRTMYVVDSEQLAVLVQAPPGRPRTDTNRPWRFVNSPIFWMTSDRVSQPLDAAAYAKLGDEAKWYNTSEPYVAVLQPTSRRMPQAGSGGTFLSGSFEGTLVIFDRATRQPACRAKLVATNSDKVQTDAIRVGFLKMPIGEQKAVADDFKKQLKGAAEVTCRKMTNGQIGLSFPGVDPD